MSKSSSMVQFRLWSRGSWPQIDVVGESHHESEIRSLFPASLPSEGGHSVETTAILVPEPKNQFDTNAVAVHVEGKHVGYLAREDSAKYAPMLSALIGQGLQPQVGCSIWGYEYEDYAGTDRRGRDVYKKGFRASVRVVLDEPHLCVPSNTPPRVPHVVLPYGNAVQVSGEENHLDAIRPVLGPEGQRWVYVTLHPITEQLTRSSRNVLEVRIDGNRIGQLTPKMSAEFLPAVRLLEDLGYQATAKALVTGNRLKAEVAIHAQRAHQLKADWPGVPSIGVNADSDSLQGDPSTSSKSGGSSVEQPAQPGARSHTPVPPKPTQILFNPPPGWPPAAPGAEPPPGWVPPPDWPVAPDGWQFWVLRHDPDGSG